MPITPSPFSKKLIAWYHNNKRALPWRATKNPYYIWLSEIILQQTRVAQGTPYYHAFIENFPTVEALAAAPEAKVLKLWQGLGYYSRARNLHTAAKYIVDELDGKFPATYSEILKLKGVGDYTASAIASFCFDENTAVVDGNVYRVLSRIYGIQTPINSTPGIKEFKELAQNLIDPAQPGTFNQSIMEFGAQHCVPKNPNCMFCDFASQCKANQTGTVSQLPVKLKKLKIKKRFFNYLVVLSGDKTLLQQRTAKGIWQQLYEFPLVESNKELNLSALKKHESFLKISEAWNIKNIDLYNSDAIVHKLSHQHLHTRFWVVTLKNPLENGVKIHEVRKYAVPILISNFIESHHKFEQ